MRYESVTAHSFGPFSGQRLEFGPAMNLVWGMNEAGKSTWHAAMYVALCGRARGRGRRSDAPDFIDRLRPWDGKDWLVSGIIRLEDGRRIELHHDLAENFDSHVVDVELGRDYRSEIIKDGSPDGAVWLGLDRRSFIATACVNQADLLLVIESSNQLQEQLQRAAATSGRDSTAALALARISEALSLQVGQERRNSSRPLRQSLDDTDRATLDLAQAVQMHGEYMTLVSSVGDLERNEAVTRRRLIVARAAAATHEAEKCDERLERARALADRLPVGGPRIAVADGKMLQDAASALRAWRQRPAPPKLEGSSASELRDLVDVLPETPPEGDLQPKADVEELIGELQSATRNLSFHDSARPAGTKSSDAGGATPEVLRALSATLSHQNSIVDAGLRERLDDLTTRRSLILAAAKRRRLVRAIAGGLAIAVAVALWVLQQPILASLASLAGGNSLAVFRVIVAFAAIAGVLFLLWSLSKGGQATKPLDDDRAGLEERLRKVEYETEYWKGQKEDALRRLEGLGLIPDPLALGRLAESIEMADRNKSEIEAWEAKRRELKDREQKASSRFWDLLKERGVTASNLSAEEGMQRYRDDCRKRWVLAQQSDRRKEVEEQLRIREQLELTASDAEERRAQAEDDLIEIAGKCGLTGPDQPTLAAQLQQWLEDSERERGLYDKELVEIGNLQALLDGREMSDLQSEAQDRRRKAANLIDSLREMDERDPDQGKFAENSVQSEIATIISGQEDIDSYIATLQREAIEAAQALAEVRGQIQEREQRLPSVAEAEEDLYRAQQELERVRCLKSTLETTRDFLERAQDQVHRSIAPMLRQAVGRRLPDVTAGRYWDVRVDPENLAVHVCGANGKWRDATGLSHGAAEQIFLLLRIALAERLTKPGEVCPLLLDEVTVHSDSERTIAILECLQAISRDRQVVLFSQEDRVLEWAQTNLVAGSDKLIRLDAGDVGV